MIIERVAAAFSADSGLNAKVFYDSGANPVAWTAPATVGTCNDAAYDADGNLYIVGDAASSKTITKYAPDGSEIWTRNHGAALNGVAVLPDGSSVEVGAVASGVSIRCRAADGSVIWTRNHGATLNKVRVGLDGGIYVCGAQESSYLYSVRKYALDGTLLWSRNLGVIVAIAADASGNVYVCLSGGDCRKYTPSGTEIHRISIGGQPQSVAIDADHVYLCGNLSSSRTTRKFTQSTGSIVWTANHGAHCYGIAVASDGSVFTAGRAISGTGESIRKYSAGGTLLYSLVAGSPTLGARAVAIYEAEPGDTEIASPPIAVPIQIRAPSVANPRRALSPRVTVAVAMAPPAVSGPADPPGLADGMSISYSLLAGGNPLLSLPLASIQCRRRSGASTWLTASVATWSEPLESDLLSRIGGTVVIVARNAQHAGEFLRAVLTDVSVERVPGGAAMTLTGRVQTPSYTRQTRALFGVQRLSDDNGRRSCVCAVDPLLRPNDTVQDGEAEWIAGSIDYRITPFGASMIVTEALNG